MALSPYEETQQYVVKVSGYYRTNDQGVLTASSIHVGAMKAKSTTGSTTSTNRVSIN